MKQLADDVWQLRGYPPDASNVHLVGDVLPLRGTRKLIDFVGGLDGHP